MVADNDNALGSHPEKRSLQANDGANSYKSLLNDCALIVRALTIRALKVVPNCVLATLSQTQWVATQPETRKHPFPSVAHNNNNNHKSAADDRSNDETLAEQLEQPICELLVRFFTNQDLIRLALTLCTAIYVRAMF